MFLKRILKEYKRFITKQFKEHCINYDNENIFIPGGLSCWKDYYYQNKEQTANKLNLLKNNVDEESKKIIDSVFECFIFLLPEYKHKDHFLFIADKFFSEQDLIAQKEKIKINNELLALGINDISLFKYHCGLKFLPADALEKVENTDFIDGGAFIGDSAYIFKDYSPNKIYAFEPNDANFKKLNKNIETLGLSDTIISVNKGIGDKKETLKIYGDSVSSSLQNFSDADVAFETIEVTDIDSFVRENNLNLGVIKLDIEGYELEAIKGAIESIKKFKPVLLISIYHHPKDFFEIKPLLEELNLGYEFKVRKLLDNHPATETMLIGYAK